ncbi:RNA polymerase sigma factor [Trebonia kvetii]|uniref:RNA polymerase sigma factor n=1 Tax=Trebonia kvetii TaxID=2480626 RepID=A0A6P2BX72_9ACTN|nr:RNA polymerase sigma factor [Trebonia kvetii]TVZ01773.1 RNA polymerase sigma factor [Trebonia kvetii]
MEPNLRGRVRDGDPDAFGALFDNHSRAVYNLAFRLTGSWVEAEEVVSLTFLEAWRLRARVELDGESLRPWLLGITVNVVRNFSRAARRHKAAMARLPEPAAVPDFADEIAERIDDTARLAALRAAFGRLRPAEQEVIALCVWAGLDYAAAAEALDVPIGTVRSRLHRARGKLRQMAIEPRGDGTPRQSGGCVGEPGRRGEQLPGDGNRAARSALGGTQ